MPIERPAGAAFRTLADATPEDWRIIDDAEQEYRREHGPARGLLAMMKAIEHDRPLGVPVNVYTHCLQTATRVLKAGLDDELVVLALFHDLPETFSDNHHGLLAAEMLAPWLSERRRWVLIHHVEFQAYHFAHHPSRYRSERDRYAGHPLFAETAEFCERYDQNSFDPDYVNLPLERFAPMVRRFFGGRPPPARLAD